MAIQPMLDRYFLTAQLSTDSQLLTLESYLPASRAGVRDALDEAYHRRPVYHQVPFTYDLGAMRAQGVRYVVLSSGMPPIARPLLPCPAGPNSRRLPLQANYRSGRYNNEKEVILKG